MTTTAPVTDIPSYCYPKQYQQVLSEVTEHEMTVLHNDGLYRHIRFAKPGTLLWHFDVITWPGYLTVVGDIANGYTFTRVPDMFTFFNIGQPDGHINPSYWAEKLVTGRRDVRTYSQEKFTAVVNAEVEQHAKSLTPEQAQDLRDEVANNVLYYADWEREALDAWHDYSFNGQRLGEVSEPFWLDYDHHFLIACHAMLWGIKKFHTQHPPTV